MIAHFFLNVTGIFLLWPLYKAEGFGIMDLEEAARLVAIPVGVETSGALEHC
jgi:hypothetical protein